MAKAQFVHPDGDHLTLLNVYHAYKSSACPPLFLRRSLDALRQSRSLTSFSALLPPNPDEHERNWAYNNFLSQRALQQADNVRSQLRRSMEKHDLDLVSTPFEDKSYYVNIRKALTAGFFMQVAHKEGGKGDYMTIKDNQVVRIHMGSGMETTPEWVCFNEFVLTTSNVRCPRSSFSRRAGPRSSSSADADPRIPLAPAPRSPQFIRTVTEIRPEWLLDLAPQYYNLATFKDGETKTALLRVVRKREDKSERKAGGGGASGGGADKKRKKGKY